MEKYKWTFRADEKRASLTRRPFGSMAEHHQDVVAVPVPSPPIAQPSPGTGTGRETTTSHRLTPDCSLAPVLGRQHCQRANDEVENRTAQRQRRELQLLMAELKDRDRELNDMVAAHHKHLRVWEEDRQKVLTLEQRCSWLEGKLRRCNLVIQAQNKRMRVIDARQQDDQRALGNSQQELRQLAQRQQDATSQCQELQERNQNLNSSLLELSTQVGQLEAREEELKAMLKLKDMDMMEAARHILELTGRSRELEAILEEYALREGKELKEMEELRSYCRQARFETVRIKDELQQKTAESVAQRTELIRLRQENRMLREDLSLLGEQQDRKDELLVLARSKKERTKSELHCLHQVCENQQNDLQLLQLNLECAQEALRQQEGMGTPESQEDLCALYRDCLSLSEDTSLRTGEHGGRGGEPLACDWLVNAPPRSHTQTGTDPRAVTTRDRRPQPTAPDSAMQTSATDRLEHLLTESHKMLASLERMAWQRASPAHSLISHSSESPSRNMPSQIVDQVAEHSSLLTEQRPPH